MSATPNPQTTPAPPTEASRTIWPLSREPFVATAWAIVIVAAGILGTWLSGDYLMSAFVCCLLAIALWRVWAPVTIHLGPKGISEQTFGVRYRFHWREVARYESRESGLWLFASEEESPLAPLKSLYIPWANQREQLESIVQYYMTGVEEDAIA